MNAEDHGERLARVETRVDTVEETLSTINMKQDKILAELGRYKGAIGLFSFIVICMVTALGAIREIFASHWR